MNAIYINAFLNSIAHVLGQFGITEISKGSYSIKENMVIDKDVTAFVGIVGELRGNVSYSLSMQTAKNIVSAMMMGMSVNELDEMSRSAIAELSNMFTGNAALSLEKEKVFIDITPPSVIQGEDIYFILSFVRTLTVNMNTPLGLIEVNFGLEL